MTSYVPVLGVQRRGRNRRIGRRAPLGGAERAAFAGTITRVISWLLGLAMAGGACFGVYQGVRAVVGSERLRVRQVAVAGNARVGASEVAAYTGVRAGDRMLALDLDAAALRLRRHPWVETAHVRRELPDRVVIDIVEHEPALIVSLGDVYLANAQGHLFKRLVAADRVDAPVLTGLTREAAAKRPDAAQALVREAVELARLYTQTAAGRLEELHFDPDLGWSAVVTPKSNDVATVRMHLGADPASRLGTALAALARLRELGRRPAVIWADGKKSPGRVQVRLREDGSAGSNSLIAKAG